MKRGNEVRVGIVVIIALAVLFSGYFALRGAGWRAQIYRVRLDGPALITAGNDVRLQGMKIGVVQEIALDAQTQQPLLTLAIRRAAPPYPLYRSYKYTVRSSGIIGENYVDIQGTPLPGDQLYLPDDPAQIIPAHVVTGLAQAGDRADEIIEDVQATLQKLNVTLDRINEGVLSYDNQIKLAQVLENTAKLSDNAAQSFGPEGLKFSLGDREAQSALRATLINTALASRDLQRLSANANQTLASTGSVMRTADAILIDNRKQLGSLLANLDRTAINAAQTIDSIDSFVRGTNLEKSAQVIGSSLIRAAKNVEDASATFKGFGDERTQKELRSTLSALRESTEALRETAYSIRLLATDETTQKQLRDTLTALNATASTLATTSESLRDAAAGIENVLGDEQVQEDFKRIPAELRRTLEATTATAERVNALLGGRRKRADSVSDRETGRQERSQLSQYGFDFTARHLGNTPKKNLGDLRFQGELFNAPFRLGLDGIGEGTRFTLQTGKYLNDHATLRYGLYRSKIGLGADYRTGRFTLEGNLYDPNERSWNLYGGVRLSPSVELLLGREKRGDLRSNAIGIRVRP